MEDDIKPRNIAETLAEILPAAHVLFEDEPEGSASKVTHVAVPSGYEVRQFDNEKLMGGPRRTKATASLSETDSFIAYVQRHASDGSVVWCEFDPQTFKLSFRAVIDEHAKGKPGWREDAAVFIPQHSIEWKTWKAKSHALQDQVAFAEFLQENEDDINSSAAGLPTSLEMHKMATVERGREVLDRVAELFEAYSSTETERIQTGGFAFFTSSATT